MGEVKVHVRLVNATDEATFIADLERFWNEVIGR